VGLAETEERARLLRSDLDVTLRSTLWRGIDGSSALRFTRADRTTQPAEKLIETTSHSCRKSTDTPSAT